MKQLIVLIATVILGVSISVMVLGFGSSAEKISTTATNSLDSINASFASQAGIEMP